MHFNKLYTLLLIGLIVSSCGSEQKSAQELFSIEIAHAKKAYHTTDVLEVSIKSKKGKPVESVAYSIDAMPITSDGSIPLTEVKMGNRNLSAAVVSEGETYELNKTVKVVASKPPTLYTYRILETYPHDINAYTQGLEFKGDTLYESTGMKGRSSLRKTLYKTGEVIQQIDLANQYFGEGLSILNDKIYQLTWRENTGFIYDIQSLERLGTFAYGESREGWGLCNDGTQLYKSDGSEKIWILNPENLSEEGHIEIYTNTSIIDRVNELEWVAGKIFANIYEKAAVAIVNPKSGAVEGVIDMKGLQDQVTQHTTLDVLNGIAYKGEPNIIYVTGKNWDKLFKIEILPKQ